MTGGVALVGLLAQACAPAAPSPSAGAAPTIAAATPAPAAAAPTPPAAAATAPAAAARPGGQAIIALGEPDTLLMSESRALVGAYVRSFIANGLVRLKYPEMTVVEDLASTYAVSADGKTATFELHPGVKWQDGQAFSSDDVKFTFEYLGHPDNPHPLTDDFKNIVGAMEFKAKKATAISGLKTTADHVEISLIAP